MKETRHILRNAKAFANAFEVLRNHNEKTWKLAFKEFDKGRPTDPEDLGGADNADFVCLALSVELYLKALLRKHPPIKKLKKVDMHSWDALFRALPLDVQENIYRRWVNGNPSINPRQDFDLWLLFESKNFERFRYSHEMFDKRMGSVSFHIDKAYRLIEAIKQYLKV